MKAHLFLLCAFATVASFTGRAFAVTSEQWHGYVDTANARNAADNQTTTKPTDNTPLENMSIYAGRQSYAPSSQINEQGDPHSLFDAVRVGMNFKFD